MAYAAVLSLKQTLHSLVNQTELPLPTSTLMQLLQTVKSLQRLLKIPDDRGGSKRLEELIRDEAHKLEDTLELIDYQNLSTGSLEKEVESFIATVKELEGDYLKQVLDTPSLCTAAADSTTDFSSEMVGLCDEYTKIKKEVLSRMRPDDFGVFSLVGAGGGTGRTVAARNVFDDLCAEAFECSGWASVGPYNGCKDILLSITAQVHPHIHESLVEEGKDEIAECLHKSLMGRRYMIVLDDICSVEVWECLRKSFPEQDNGSLILLTTSLYEVAQSAESFYIYEMASLLNVDYCLLFIRSSLLLGSNPDDFPELEEAGMKIAENCRCLRLVLAKVVLFLLKVEKTPEVWNKLAADSQNSLFIVDDELLEVSSLLI